MIQHEATFSTTEVVRMVPGITFRMLDYWDKTGVIKPSIREANGTGTARAYSFVDLVIVQTLAVLRSNGMDLSALRRISGFFRAHPDESRLEIARLVVTDDEMSLVDSDTGALLELEHLGLSNTFCCWVVDVGAIVESLRGKLTTAPEDWTYTRLYDPRFSKRPEKRFSRSS